MIDLLTLVTWSGAMLGSGYLIRSWEERRRMNRVYSRLLAEIREEEAASNE